ncbi:MAG: molybdopterin-dependent oxidoreductase [Candidatus Eremiobacteraeota bacterium]|nr:molybdopterin-dependent oxidoreductase [Candidatus Eremiobacteraeota bacterium]
MVRGGTLVTLRRAHFLGLLAASSLTGCARIGTALTENETFHKVLDAPERLNLALLGAGQPLAYEYPDSAISPDFRHNGFDPPSDPQFTQWSRNGWHGYRLFVSGLVDNPTSFSVEDLRTKFTPLTQTTRHDCVEGWSVIGKWRGVRLRDVVAAAAPKSDAKFVVFRCLDDDGTGTKYYESLDMRQAAHPQALLAYDLNGELVPLKNGAPVRLRVPTQLGYKSAKHVGKIELVAALGGENGKGGYWEDQGYEWFAGI